MPNVTLVMTRQPLAEFLWMDRGRRDAHYEEIEDEAERTQLFGVKNAAGRRIDTTGQTRGLLSGQWGTMAVVEGPIVISGARTHTLGETIDAIGTIAETPALQASRLMRETITLAGQTVTLYGIGSITRVTEFDTMERYRTDSNKNSWYVRLPAQPHKPFPVVGYNAPNVAAFHRKLGIRRQHPGMCLRVLDHPVKQPNTNVMAGILLHEATNIGWLTGCIAPRTKNHRTLSSDITHCVEALDTIYAAMGGFGINKRASLLIID